MENEKLLKNANKYHCDNCYFYTSNKYDFNKHLMTLKHINNIQKTTLEINGTIENVSKNASFNCSECNFYSNNKTNYDKHLLTEKHKKSILRECEEPKMVCSNCNKEYNTHSGLWKHKRKCTIIISNKEPETEQEEESEQETEPLQNTFIPNDSLTKVLFMEVLKESKELQNVLIGQNKELQNKLLEKDNILIEQNNKILELAKNQQVINNNTTNNTNNNQFNLQFYLNETCKDAMNIVDFVNSLKLTTDDFETTGKLGFVEGISRIFIKALKQMEKEKLPIHCTDLKRETVYIKDKNIWEKENDDKRKLKWTIDRIAQLNLNQNQNWLEKYPVCKENNTKENEKFTAMALVALGGRGEEEDNKYREKIMRNVLKEVVLDKKNCFLK